METVDILQQVATYGFAVLFVVFGMVGVISAVQFQKHLMDVAGAIVGLKKSVLYFVLAVLSSALMVFASDPTGWLNSICFFTVSIILLLVFYGVRYWQLSSFQNKDRKDRDRRG